MSTKIGLDCLPFSLDDDEALVGLCLRSSPLSSSSSILLTPVVLSGSTIACLISESLLSEGSRGLFERDERELECDDERCDELLLRDEDDDFLLSSRFLSLLDFFRSFDRDDEEREDEDLLLLELFELFSDFGDFESFLRRRGSRSDDSRFLSASRDFDWLSLGIFGSDLVEFVPIID